MLIIAPADGLWALFSMRNRFGCLVYLRQFGMCYRPNLAELAIPCQQAKKVPNSRMSVHEPESRCSSGEDGLPESFFRTIGLA